MIFACARLSGKPLKRLCQVSVEELQLNYNILDVIIFLVAFFWANILNFLFHVRFCHRLKFKKVLIFDLTFIKTSSTGSEIFLGASVYVCTFLNARVFSCFLLFYRNLLIRWHFFFFHLPIINYLHQVV